MTKSIVEIQEGKWEEFYKNQGSIRENDGILPRTFLEKVGCEDIIEKFDISESKNGLKEDYTQIFFDKEGKFDCNRYFEFIFLVRLLNTGQKSRYDKLLGESNKHFDDETFQQYVNSRQIEEGLLITETFFQFWRWWANIGRDPEPYIDNMDGYNNRFIHDRKVPNYVKVHILSRFIMKRNAAMKGSKNFQTDSKIAEDSRNALRYGEKFLRMAKEETGRNFSDFHNNEYYSAKSVSCLFEIERLLFITRTEKDINHIIQTATAVLGSALTIENRVWSAICTYWCNHILWRCFVCKGDIKISNSFRETCRVIIEDYLPGEPFKLKLKGNYSDEGHFSTYDTSKAKKHWEIIENMILMGGGIPYQKQLSSVEYRLLEIERDIRTICLVKLKENSTDMENKREKDLQELREERNKINKNRKEITKKKADRKKKNENRIHQIKFGNKDRNAKARMDDLERDIEALDKEIENLQKDNKNDILFEVRRESYIDFMGLDGKKLKIPRRGKGNTISFFGPSRNTKNAWETKIEYISDFLNYSLSNLEKSSTIVAIPTAKLVIFDVLLLFSRISLSLNRLAASNKPIDTAEEKKIEQTWEVVKGSLQKIRSEIERAKIHLEMVTGKDKIDELEKIIEKIDQITKGEELSQSEFIIITREGNKKTSLNNSRKAGEEMQKLLKELIEKNKIKLYFPIKS